MSVDHSNPEAFGSDWVQEGRLEKFLEDETSSKDLPEAELLTDEERKIYLDLFRDKMDAPLNWYRTRKINFECEKKGE